MILFKKMCRDMRQSIFSYAACAFVIMIGIMMYISSVMARDNLVAARDAFYSGQNFADGYIELNGAPANVADRVRRIKGIRSAEGRIVKDVRVIIDGEKRNVTLRLVSGLGEGAINTVRILDGRMPKPDENAAVIGTKFYNARRLKPGSVLTLASEGRRIDITVAGAGQSPEFVFAIKDGQDMLPDPETFEIAYVGRPLAEQITGMGGKVNSIIFTMDGSADYKDIERDLKNDLQAYGVKSVYAKKDQPSNSMLNEEFKQLEQMSRTVPVLFLAIAAIILYIMLRRLVEQQRGQIGIMKAFGYRYGDIVLHYASYGAAAGLAGGVLGSLAGLWLSFVYTDLYKVYYSLPDLKNRLSWGYFAGAVLISVAFSVFAAYAGARKVLKLPPADSMRPPVPSFGKRAVIEGMPGFSRVFNLQGSMAVRNLYRNYKRSLLVLAGIVFTFGLMASMLSLSSLSTQILTEHFTKVQRYDVKVSLSRPGDFRDTSREIEKQRGVIRVEPLFEMPAELSHMNHKKNSVILCLQKGSQLYKIFDTDGNQVAVPDSGIMLSKHIAEVLGAKVGDVIVVNSPYAREKDLKLTVTCIISQYIGSNAYISRDVMERITGSAYGATSLMVLADSEATLSIKDKYATAKNVAMIEQRQETIDKYNKLLGATTATIWIMALISVLTVFAVVYTSSIISLEERQREFSLLRLIGMRLGEVMDIITVEQWIIGAAGMLLGIPVALLFDAAIVKGMSSDIYTIPSSMSADNFIWSAIGVAAAILVSNLWIKRRVKRINMIEALSAGVRE